MTKSFRLSVVSLIGLVFALASTTHVLGQHARPFKLNGQATWDDLNNAFDPMVGASFQDGNGTASHLGRFRATANLFATAPPNMNGDFPVMGNVLLIAANGDELHTVYSGILNVNGAGVANYMFVGGTGRFQGAAGSGQIFASFDVSSGLQNVPMDVRWVGTVVY